MQPGADDADSPGPAPVVLEPRPKNFKASPGLSAWDIQVYRVCEELTTALIFLMVIFSPWAFGTTQAWSIWTMNIAGYVLGVAFAMKLLLRRLRGYAVPRWDRQLQGRNTAQIRDHAGKRITRVLAALTVAILAWCLLSAMNARATFDNTSLAFDYHECISWLPHSFDRDATWFAFWMYLGLACAFWAVRDWLLGKSTSEERASWHAGRGSSLEPAPLLPARLRRLLWLLAINGALLGIEAIIQRSVSSPELLFLVKPRIHQTADGQFGPYAYRSNAAQYFNLLWPVCLGFWWTLNRRAGAGQDRYHLLLVAAAVMAACPIVSTSRAGAIVTLLIAILGACFLALTHFVLQSGLRSGRRKPALRAVALCIAGALVLGFALGWKTLSPRMAQLNDGLAGREQMYEAARPIARDYPLFGTGPGSFETVSQLYPRPDMFWPSQLHNDWLETRITFGWLGSGLIGLSFLCVLLRWFAPGGIHGGRRFVTLTWFALAGCLLHARYDFPFQIHSTLFLFLLLCGILSVLSRRPAG